MEADFYRIDIREGERLLQSIHVHRADGTLAGSVLAMNEAVRNFARTTRAPIERVVEMVTRTPAEELGIYEETGSLEEEKRADLTLFDDELNIAATSFR